MNKFFYTKLACINIKNNAKFNIPYMLTCIGTIMMFYLMNAITYNTQMSKMPSGDNLQIIMKLGCYVIGIFAVIFLFYTNSFLMKRRKKEIGLYNILGMEKRHIAKILLMESIITFTISFILGILCGIVFDKLIMMLFSKIVDFNTVLKFEISGVGIKWTILLFALIFIGTLLYNQAKIQMSKPIELINGSKTGEKEPKTKIIMTILGVLCIGVAYIIANTVESPVEAIYWFFLAVVLVIVGTYFLFIAGSIAFLKILKKNKKYYYNIKHFNSVSGMLYRMKQNAVGLANICILSTMVLVMISTTVSMYIGVEDSLKYRYPNDVSMYFYEDGKQVSDANTRDKIAEKMVRDTANSENIKIDEYKSYNQFTFSTKKVNDNYIYDKSYSTYNPDGDVFNVITLADYNRLSKTNIELKDNEILYYSDKFDINKNVNILGKDFTVKQKVKAFPMEGEITSYLLTVHYLVVKDKSVLTYLYNHFGNEKDGKNYIEKVYCINLGGTESEKLDYYKVLQAKIQLYQKNQHYVPFVTTSESRQDNKQNFYSMYGCLLFLGIFLGVLFLMATVLIIYYKQISEGYEDKDRFAIMEKVGMSKAEVKGSIKSQVLTVFSLPIIVAGIHVLASFKVVTKLLAMMNLTNVSLFTWCTLGTIIVFAIIYLIVYLLTAKVYYKIVE